MRPKFTLIPNTYIEGLSKPPIAIKVTLEVKVGDPYQTEVVRLEAKYGRVLSKKEMAHELGISIKTLTERMHKGVDIPEYKETALGRHIFPISAVAAYLSKGLIKTS